jgi:TonB family protein
MSGFESWVLSCFVNSLWQIPVLMGAGSLIARALRRLGPEAEHRVWVGVLLLSSLLPLISVVPLTGFLARLGWIAAAADGHVTVLMGAGAAPGGFLLPHRLLAGTALAFAAVCLWFAVRFVWRCARLGRIRKEASDLMLCDEAACAWERCSLEFGIEGVAVASSSRIFGPVTIGLRQKLVILPASLLSTVKAADLEAVIAHEFAHIRRHDFVKNLLYEFIALPVSYHPLLWAIRAQVMESREMVCDRMAAATGSRKEYAHSLLRLAGLLLQGVPVTTPHAIGIFDANSFERRIMRLTERTKPIHGLRRIAMVTACSVLGLAIAGSALALSVHVNGQDSGSQPSEHPKAISVSPKVMQGQRLNGPMPVYPPDAKKAKVQGKVVLDAVIGKDGTVEKLTVVSGPDALQKSAMDAVRDWTYKPFLLNGEPVDVKTTITVTYSLGK